MILKWFWWFRNVFLMFLKYLSQKCQLFLFWHFWGQKEEARHMCHQLIINKSYVNQYERLLRQRHFGMLIYRSPFIVHRPSFIAQRLAARGLRLGFEPTGLDLIPQEWLWAPRAGFKPPGLDLSPQTWIWAPRVRFKPPGLHLSPQGWIWAHRAGFQLPVLHLSFQGWI